MQQLRKLVSLGYLVFAASAFGQHGDPRNVLLVQNTNSSVSQSIASYYAAARNIPAANILGITTQNSASSTTNETITYNNYLSQIKTPIINYINAHPELEIRFIVLTKGIPHRVQNSPKYGFYLNSTQGHMTSVDSLLASAAITIFQDVQFTGGANPNFALINTYWGFTPPFARTSGQQLYLVTRLDAYTQADVIGMIDRAVAANGFPGQFLLDTDSGKGYTNPANQPLNQTTGVGYADYNSDMEQASIVLGGGLIPSGQILLDKTTTFLASAGTDLNGYCSWGSNDGHFDVNAYRSFQYVNGGLAETAVSTSARTLLDPLSAGQSLICDLLSLSYSAKPATGVKGYCQEPYLNAIASPTYLFPNYVRGHNLAEAYYCATRYVAWMDVVFGDPLCRPKGATVYGTLTLQDFVGAVANVNVTMEVLQGQTVVASKPVGQKANGSYSISLDVSGTYDVRFRTTHWLSKRYPMTSVNQYVNLSPSLINGDITGNNTVDDEDLLQLILDFGGAGNPSLNGLPQSDLNGDNAVDDEELIILVLAFGQSGS